VGESDPARGQDGQGPELEAFWDGWRSYYGESGLANRVGTAADRARFVRFRSFGRGW
jgi:hypothetical protein